MSRYASFLPTVHAQEVFRYPCLYAQSEIRRPAGPAGRGSRRGPVTGSLVHSLWTSSSTGCGQRRPDGTASDRPPARPDRDGPRRRGDGDAGPERRSGPASVSPGDGPRLSGRPSRGTRRRSPAGSGPGRRCPCRAFFAQARMALFCSRSAVAPPRPARGPATDDHAAATDLGAAPRRTARIASRNLLGVLLRQVDLVLNAVERELDGLVRVPAVQVIDQLVNDLLGHVPHSFRAGCAPANPGAQ